MANSQTKDPYLEKDKLVNEILKEIPKDDDNGFIYIRFHKNSISSISSTRVDRMAECFLDLVNNHDGFREIIDLVSTSFFRAMLMSKDKEDNIIEQQTEIN